MKRLLALGSHRALTAHKQKLWTLQTHDSVGVNPMKHQSLWRKCAAASVPPHVPLHAPQPSSSPPLICCWSLSPGPPGLRPPGDLHPG